MKQNTFLGSHRKDLLNFKLGEVAQQIYESDLIDAYGMAKAAMSKGL